MIDFRFWVDLFWMCGRISCGHDSLVLWVLVLGFCWWVSCLVVWAYLRFDGCELSGVVACAGGVGFAFCDWYIGLFSASVLLVVLDWLRWLYDCLGLLVRGFWFWFGGLVVRGLGSVDCGWMGGYFGVGLGIGLVVGG